MKILEEVLKTEDGFDLRGEIRIPDVQYKKVIIMCHGLTSCKEGRRGQL